MHSIPQASLFYLWTQTARLIVTMYPVESAEPLSLDRVRKCEYHNVDAVV